MKRFRAAVLGGSGFAGAELCRRLLAHPEVELVRVCAKDHIGKPLSAAHPNLEGASDLVFEDLPPERAAADVDIVIMGLPHDVSVELVQAVHDLEVRVLDLSGAFRLKNLDDYARFYGGPHPAPALVERFVYGLPELERDRIAGARFVASPGCFATTTELGLLPFARSGLLNGPVQSVGVTGSSGSGVVPSATTHHPVRAGNLRTYRPLAHQHEPEIVDTLRRAGAKGLELAFVPVSAPLVRGLFVTSFFRVGADVSDVELAAAVTASYAGEPFVRVPRQRLPEVVAVAGSNFAEVGWAASAPQDGERVVTVFSALDNLMKGGAGQAIQNMNLMLGLDERLTLSDPGGYP